MHRCRRDSARVPSEDTVRLLGAEQVEFEDLLSRSDFLTLHTPRNAETANILNRETLARVKPGCHIINCATGGLIDEQALAEAIRDGWGSEISFDSDGKGYRLRSAGPDGSAQGTTPTAGDAATAEPDGRGAGPRPGAFLPGRARRGAGPGQSAAEIPCRAFPRLLMAT